jgi:hypothetical protein
MIWLQEQDSAELDCLYLKFAILEKKRVVVMGKTRDDKRHHHYQPTQGYRKTPLANVSFVHGPLLCLHNVALVYDNGNRMRKHGSVATKYNQLTNAG